MKQLLWDVSPLSFSSCVCRGGGPVLRGLSPRPGRLQTCLLHLLFPERRGAQGSPGLPSDELILCVRHWGKSVARQPHRILTVGTGWTSLPCAVAGRELRTTETEAWLVHTVLSEAGFTSVGLPPALQIPDEGLCLPRYTRLPGERRSSSLLSASLILSLRFHVHLLYWAIILGVEADWAIVSMAGGCGCPWAWGTAPDRGSWASALESTGEEEEQNPALFLTV